MNANLAFSAGQVGLAAADAKEAECGQCNEQHCVWLGDCGTRTAAAGCAEIGFPQIVIGHVDDACARTVFIPVAREIEIGPPFLDRGGQIA